MSERLYSQIYAHLLDYLDQKLTLEEFRDWFDSSTWRIHSAPVDPAAQELAGEIELRLSEFASGHWSENELRDQLKTFVPTHMASRPR